MNENIQMLSKQNISIKYLMPSKNKSQKVGATRGSVHRVMLFFVAALTLVFGGCRHNTVIGEKEPVAPDYSDTTQWFVMQRGADVDIFYIVSTEIGDYLDKDSVLCHYADTRLAFTRDPMRGEMEGVDYLISGNLNFYAPYYRQCSLESFTSDSLAHARTSMPISDLRRAFNYYLDTLSCGRPFILMGFSQGAIGVLELVKTMDSIAYSRMVAAYVIGWKINDSDIDCPFLRPACDSTDLGVTVCYNSVRSVECAIPIISDGNVVAINPVNWRTDAVGATLVSPISGDTVTVTLDTASRMLLVDGYSGQDYMLPLIGREGNYHRLELSLYRDVLRRNVALRASRWCAAMEKQ